MTDLWEHVFSLPESLVLRLLFWIVPRALKKAKKPENESLESVVALETSTRVIYRVLHLDRPLEYRRQPEAVHLAGSGCALRPNSRLIIQEAHSWPAQLTVRVTGKDAVLVRRRWRFKRKLLTGEQLVLHPGFGHVVFSVV